MFGRTRTDVVDERPFEARGGVSLLSTFTGVLVALGTLFLLSALVAGIIEALDEFEEANGTVEIGIGAGIAFVVAQFIAYLWGGYTAARMGRGAGLAHGLLVPIFALILAALVAGLAAALGAVSNLGLPFTETRLPVERDYLIDWGAGVGIGSLVAMFVGGVIGGIRGARWHTRLEAEKRTEAAEATGTTLGTTTTPGTTDRDARAVDVTDRNNTATPDETDTEASEAPASPFARPPDTPVPSTVVPPPAEPRDDRSP
jgi:hypothetical protein